jgi:hypothetical protein
VITEQEVRNIESSKLHRYKKAAQSQHAHTHTHTQTRAHAQKRTTRSGREQTEEDWRLAKRVSLIDDVHGTILQQHFRERVIAMRNRMKHPITPTGVKTNVICRIK